MTEAEKKMKKYVTDVERRLNLPMEIKARVMSDFSSSIVARREAGQSDEDIMAELGSPKKVAAELNEQMKEFTYKLNPWRWAFLALAIWGFFKILPGIWANIFMLILNIKANLSPNDAYSVGIIGGADGPTAIFLTTPDWVHYVLPVLAIAVGVFGYIKLKKPE